MQTKVQLSIPVSFFREGKYFIAHTPTLDLSTSGKTYEEAGKRFQQVLEIFFEELTEKGTLAEVLLSQGWVHKETSWLPPIPVASQMAKISIPVVN